MTKICRAEETETSNIDKITPETFFKHKKPSDFILRRWMYNVYHWFIWKKWTSLKENVNFQYIYVQFLEK